MGILDKAKSVAEQTTKKAKDEIGDVQKRRELGQMYDELGRLAYELAEKNEISHIRLKSLVDRIHELEAKLHED